MKTILIIDDTKENLDILVELLGDDYDIIPSIDAKDGIEIAKEEEIDLILLDIMMPVLDGFEVCKILKEDKKTKEIPVIFLTAKSDEESIERAYDIGGSDYVTKPFKPKELKARIKRELQLQDLQNELRMLSTTDPLTKLYNRRYFSQASHNLFNLSKREKKELSIVMIDIDNFKTINDTYGHQIGDKVIMELANILRDSSRKSDMSCRYGGEEFVMLLYNTSLEGAKKLAEEIREKAEKRVIQIDEVRAINFTVSIGISKILPEDDENIEFTLKRADDALYEAKRNGKNRVCSNLDPKACKFQK